MKIKPEKYVAHEKTKYRICYYDVNNSHTQKLILVIRK